MYLFCQIRRTHTDVSMKNNYVFFLRNSSKNPRIPTPQSYRVASQELLVHIRSPDAMQNLGPQGYQIVLIAPC